MSSLGLGLARANQKKVLDKIKKRGDQVNWQHQIHKNSK